MGQAASVPSRSSSKFLTLISVGLLHLTASALRAYLTHPPRRPQSASSTKQAPAADPRQRIPQSRPRFSGKLPQMSMQASDHIREQLPDCNFVLYKRPQPTRRQQQRHAHPQRCRSVGIDDLQVRSGKAFRLSARGGWGLAESAIRLARRLSVIMSWGKIANTVLTRIPREIRYLHLLFLIVLHCNL